MKQLFLILLLGLWARAGFTQGVDTLVMHNGKRYGVVVREITSQVVKYSYPGENVVQTFGRPAVASILYSSGRVETISERVWINNEVEFEKVVILTHPDQALGLVDRGDVQGKTAAISYQTAGTAQRASMNRIRRAAIRQNAQFVLILESNNPGFAGFGASQSIRSGKAYSYE